MSEKVVKTCDFPVGRGTNIRPHGEVVEGSTTYHVDGVEYTVELCSEHRSKFDEVLAPFLAVSRRSGKIAPRNSRGRAVMRARGGLMFTTNDVRKWMLKEGMPVAETGRIPNADIQRYKDEHGIV